MQAAMKSLVFDTHAAATRFKAAGFSDDQVEALVAVTRETTGLPDISTLATKSDLDQVETRLNHRIDQLETKLNGKIDTVRAGLKSDLDQVETRLNGKIDQLDRKIDGVRAELKSDIAELKVMMANMQVQTLTILLPSMVVIVTLATVLSKLIH
jgi:outer membrane murein-binding lipoprotein Lpp